jgi:hypothetical protein
VAVLTMLLSVLMLSHVPYAPVPRVGYRTPRALAATAFMTAGLVAAITIPRYWFFPALICYTTWGLMKAFVLGLLDRLPDRDPLLDEDTEAEELRAEVRSMDYGDLTRSPYPHRLSDEDSTEEST